MPNQKEQRPVMPRGPMGPGRMGMGGEKAKNFNETMVTLARYMKPFYAMFGVAIILAIGSTVFSIVGPKILGNATTLIFEGLSNKIAGTGGIDFDAILNIILLLLGLYSASVLFSFAQGFMMSGVAQKTSYKLRNEISDKINRLPLGYYDKTSTGDVLSRVTNDVDTIANTLNQSLASIITSMATIVGVLIMMFSISWQMTLVALVVLPVSGMLIGVVVKSSQKYFRRQQTSLGAVNGHVEEMYSGHNIIKVFNQEAKSQAAFDAYNDDLYRSAWKSQFFSSIMMPLMNLVTNFGYVVIVVLGGFLTIQGKISVGDIQAFIQYVRSFNQPIAQFAQIANVLQSTAAAAERVFEFLDATEELEDAANACVLEGVKGEVTFENVRFGYDPKQIIIPNFSAQFAPGSKIAIVGPTGAGKTTLVKLLMRFYDIQGGDIKIDGTSIYDVKRHSLRDTFGMVLQDTWLFNGSIKENIRYGNLAASEEEIFEAAKAARVDHFVRTLEDGYETILNEEASNVSQGQKQLLTIARAFISDPKILILDEATSSVDTRTEVLIQEAMEALMATRTSFIIAHRLSTIRNADTILVLDKGDIVEQGNHDTLMAKDGFYAKLYASQFDGE
ncbi:MAG: ABC transporter ATP-binding protein [Erysipelotrichaceae bacterium]